MTYINVMHDYRAASPCKLDKLSVNPPPSPEDMVRLSTKFSKIVNGEGKENVKGSDITQKKHKLNC